MSHDDFAFEPKRGLPGPLPPGEEILWQGAPDPRALLREAFGLRWILIYFGAISVWRIAASATEMAIGPAILTALPFALLCAAAVVLLYGLSWVMARATVYTITTERVLMRVGAALTVTFNIPFRWIGNANMDLRSDGTGTIALQTTGDSKISYLVAWPHVRPWRMGQTEPALRCIPDAEKVAAILREAAEDRLARPEVMAGPVDAPRSAAASPSTVPAHTAAIPAE
ncbi:MAG: photosynthetic complex putative assembly protein PuhB [Rhodobacteraceae bacterium]|nr:photosynthetic complex putative assembly protein PuhB [Paracoccaceae bacterium]